MRVVAQKWPNSVYNCLISQIKMVWCAFNSLAMCEKKKEERRGKEKGETVGRSCKRNGEARGKILMKSLSRGSRHKGWPLAGLMALYAWSPSAHERDRAARITRLTLQPGPARIDLTRGDFLPFQIFWILFRRCWGCAVLRGRRRRRGSRRTIGRGRRRRGPFSPRSHRRCFQASSPSSSSPSLHCLRIMVA